MPFEDEVLLDFDRSRLAGWDEERARVALEEFPDLYRNHLMIAKWIDAWIEGMQGGFSHDKELQAGFEQGLREIAAHLRQGDFIPGGGLYGEIASQTP